MKITQHFHNDAQEAVPKHILHPLKWDMERKEVIPTRKGVREIKEAIAEVLASNGWSGRTIVHPDSKISIASINENVGLCFQFANMCTFCVDLLKLQVMYDRKTIDSAIYILPVKRLALTLGNNMSNFERFTQELKIYKNIIKIPIAILGVEKLSI
jgi:hypothetical protein